MKKFAKMAVAAAIAGLSLVAQAELVIDDFNTGQAFLKDTSSNGLGLSNTQNGAGILGGWRDLFVSKIGNPINDGTGRGVEIGVDAAAPGTLSFSSDSGQNGYGIVRWDGSHFDGFGTIDATGLGGVNLNAFGNAFQLNVIDADLNFPFKITIYTDAANYTTLDLFSTGPFPSSDTIDFSSFLGGSGVTPEGFIRTSFGTGVNFSSIGAIEATINTGGLITNVDLQIDLVRVVPEPGSLALTGLAIFALGAMRRRKAA